MSDNYANSNGVGINGTHTTTWSGIWASAQSGNIAYQKIGKLVTLTIPILYAAATSASSILADTNLPASLRPNGSIGQPILVIDNASINSFTNGSFSVGTSGDVAIYAGPAFGTAFAGISTTGSSGVWKFTVQYLTV